MEMGDFMEPGQQALDQVEHRGAVKVFGVSSSQGVRASKMGQVVSTAYQEHVVFSVLFFFIIVLSCMFTLLVKTAKQFVQFVTSIMQFSGQRV